MERLLRTHEEIVRAERDCDDSRRRKTKKHGGRRERKFAQWDPATQVGARMLEMRRQKGIQAGISTRLGENEEAWNRRIERMEERVWKEFPVQ